MIESYVKYKDGMEIKYPLQFHTFKDLFTEGERKGSQQTLPI